MICSALTLRRVENIAGAQYQSVFASQTKGYNGERRNYQAKKKADNFSGESV